MAMFGEKESWKIALCISAWLGALALMVSILKIMSYSYPL